MVGVVSGAVDGYVLRCSKQYENGKSSSSFRASVYRQTFLFSTFFLQILAFSLHHDGVGYARCHSLGSSPCAPRHQVPQTRFQAEEPTTWSSNSSGSGYALLQNAATSGWLTATGNLHSILKTEDVHLQFQKWAEQYGPIYSLILGTKTLIVVNHRKVVKDLLDHKSNQYSSRPDMYVGQDLISGGYRLVFMKYDDEWRLARKMIHNLLNAKKAVDYVPYQELELKQMLSDMIDRPSAFHDHVRRYSTSLVTTFVFGWRSPSFHDPAVKQIYDGFEEFALASQVSSSLLDYYPILRKLPDFINPMSRKGKALHREEIALYKDYIHRVRERQQKGISPPCFCTEALFRAQEKHGFTDDWASYVSGTLLEAGSDTTASIFVGFIVAMVNFPRVQKKAQEELDGVVGPNRLPSMDDDLPYIRMIVKETLRYLPSSILGIVPHATSSEDFYAVGDESYYIPKGAGVMLNVWTLNNDPEKYPNPREFRPER